MEPVDLALGRAEHAGGQCREIRGIGRLDEMPTARVAVAQVDSGFAASGDRVDDSGDSLGEARQEVALDVRLPDTL